MATAVAKFAAKKLMSKELKKYKTKQVSDGDDPYYAVVEVPGKAGKLKKVKKQIPDYIPEQEAIVLAKVRRRAYFLDMALFTFLGTRFGWSSIVGLIPAFGDVFDLILALSVIKECEKVSCGLGNSTRGKMQMNAFLDFLIGIVPFIGDYGDALFKANTKNVRLLELRLDEVYKPQAGKERAKQEQMTNHPPAPATVYEDFSDPEDSELPPPTGAAKKKSQRSKNRRATGRSGGQDIEMGVQT